MKTTLGTNNIKTLTQTSTKTIRQCLLARVAYAVEARDSKAALRPKGSLIIFNLRSQVVTKKSLSLIPLENRMLSKEHAKFLARAKTVKKE